MPINTKHSGYKESIRKVTRVRDFAAGEDAVKDKGETYLPKLSGQTQAEYEAYLLRGYLTPSVEPTVRAIAGSIMRRPAVFSGGLDYLKDNVNGTGEGLNIFTQDMISELLLAGGVGYLVEHDGTNAYIKTYTRENVTNYGADFIVLSQTYVEANPKDKYEQTEKTEYLELTYDDGGYIQNIWREGKTGWSIVETVIPTNRGDRIAAIPFVFVTPSKLGFQSADPILLHLTNVNADQYRLSTDLRHGLHWTALPTLFLYGDLRNDDGSKKQIKIGAGSANHIEDTDARAELLEFTGAGLGSVTTAVDSLIVTMASIGAKMLADTSGGVKTAETSRIDASSETATLSTIANTVDLAMANLLEIIAAWTGSTAPDYKINRDFIDVKLDPQSLVALLQTWQSGGMSLDSFLYQLEKGELLPPDISAEEEAGRIETTGTDFDLGAE